MRTLALLLLIHCAAVAQTFSFSSTIFPIPSGPILVGDFNGDGIPDLLVSGELQVLLGKGDGTFQAPIDSHVIGTTVAIADWNGDGKLDVIVQYSNGGAAVVLLGNGDGTFQQPINTGFFGYYFVSGDFNGDGKADLAMARYGEGRVDVALGKGDGTFLPAVQYPVGNPGAGTSQLAVADFNGDGKADIVAVNVSTSNMVILLGNGDGSFQPAVSNSAGGSFGASCVAVGDVNGDGRPDVAIGGGGQLVIFIGNGNGTFQSAHTIRTAPGFNVTSAAIADFNGDGKADIVSAVSSSPSSITILAGLGDGTFGAVQSFEIDVGQIVLAVSDLNRDGKLDVVTANPVSNLSILLNTGPAATFVRQDTTTQGSWHGVYGGDGYTVIGDTASNPSYVTPSPTGQSLVVWAPSTADVRALEKGSNLADRIAGAWYAANSFTVDLPFTDNATHQLAAYFLDWDTTARRQTVEILNGNDSVLNTQTLNGSFHGGVYLVWNVNGHVKIRVTVTAGANPLLSGLFFGIGNPASPSLTIHKTHNGNFATGQQNAAYTVTVANSAGAAATAGTVTVSETVPSGLSLASMAGTGWTCGAATCSRSDPLLGGNSYPPISVMVSVSGIATTPQVNQVSVSGGGSAPDSTSDSTNITQHVLGPRATFIKLDATTRGSWRGVYGSDGYVVIGDQAANPSFVTPTPTGQSQVVWAPSTSDVRALQKGSNAADRVAGGWYAANTFTVDLSITDGLSHQLAVYALDWDTTDRRETVDILDPSNNVLNSQSLTGSFSGGVYLVWTVGDHVKVRVTVTGGANPVLSGIFFDPAGIVSGPVMSVTKTHTGNFTQGQKNATYTLTVSNIGGSATTESVSVFDSIPIGMTVVSTTGSGWLCTAPTCSRDDSLAAGSSFPPITVTVNVLAGAGSPLVNQAFVSGGNSAQTSASDSTIITASGSSTSSATFLRGDTLTQGNWRSVYGGDGYNIIGDQSSNPAYVTPAATGQTEFTWVASTTDIRALQKASNSTDRVAAGWYTSGSFTIDLPITDAGAHQIALYLLDWDTTSRNEKLEILDANGTVLNSVNSSSIVGNFHGGIYYVWNVSGHVKIRVTLTGGANAVVSGIFFGSAGIPSSPNLSITMNHSGTFTQGQQNALYTVTVSNAPNAAPTGSSAVTVTETIPSGLSLVAMGGAGWFCNSNICNRTDQLTGGSSYPPITVEVKVAANASSPQVNQVSVSGGGSQPATAVEATIIGLVGSGPSTAAFVNIDTTTHGGWRGVYGGDGFSVLGDQSSNPSYVTPAPSGQNPFTWVSSTSDVRALQKNSNPGDRIAAGWYSGSSFTVDLPIADASTHLLTVYCLDWDTTSRRETVDILDASGNVLSSQSLTGSFNSGVYLLWNVTGHVKVRVTATGGANAVISGLFFDTVTTGSPATFAALITQDPFTQGNWHVGYGHDGYIVLGDQSSNPTYVIPSPAGQVPFTWEGSTTDVRALQKPSNLSDRVAGGWYADSSFTVDLPITDANPHRLAVYCLDWDTTARRETLEILDVNDNVLSTSSLTTSFNGGVYIIWNVAGHVKIRVTATAGANAVISGIFFR
jgi:uncharacterized repeat protein (TIGR01451 family)